MPAGQRPKEGEEDWREPLTVSDIPDTEVLAAFFKYLYGESEQTLKHRLNASGKNIDDVDLSSNSRYVRMRKDSRRNEIDDSSVFHNPEQKAYEEAQRIRQRRLKQKRMSYAEEKKECEVVLQKLFDAYNRCALEGVPEEKHVAKVMGTIGFMRIVRDCGLMDNRFGFVETDDFFTAAASKLYEEDDRPFKGDWLIDFKAFRQLMRKLAKVKYPLAPKVDDALQCLVDRYLGPLAKVSPGPLIVDQMMSRGSLELWRKHDDVMKRIYCHYATLDFLSADKVSWKGVRERNSTMSLSELTLQMINFAVNPGLLTKNQLRDIMHAVDAENDADVPEAFLLKCTKEPDEPLGMPLQRPETTSTISYHKPPSVGLYFESTALDSHLVEMQFPNSMPMASAGGSFTPRNPSMHVERWPAARPYATFTPPPPSRKALTTNLGLAFPPPPNTLPPPTTCSVTMSSSLKSPGMEVGTSSFRGQDTSPHLTPPPKSAVFDEIDPEESADRILYPAFQEVIARAAKKVFAQLPHKIIDPNTNVLEMNAYRNFVLCLSPEKRGQFERVLEQRGYMPDVSEMVGPQAVQRFRESQAHYEEVAETILEQNTRADEWAAKYHKQVQMHLKGQSQQRLLTRRAYTASILDASGFKGYTPPAFTRLASPTRTRSTSMKGSSSAGSSPVKGGKKGKQAALSAEASIVESLQEFDDHLHEMAWERPVDEMKHWKARGAVRASV